MIKNKIEIGDVGMAFICDFLPDNKALKSLKLVKNKITDEGFYMMFRALQNNFSLQTLNLT